MKKESYILWNEKENKPIALDHSSGGYPYTVDSIFHAKFWQSFEIAANYKKMFREKGFSLRKIQVEISEPLDTNNYQG